MKSAIFKNYYEEYLEVCNSIEPKSLLIDSRKFIKNKHILREFYLPFNVCLIDYQQRNYVYLCDNVEELVGHPREKYITGGVNFHNSLWHPDDWAVFQGHIFYDIMEYWKLIPPGEFNSYQFAFCYRIIRNNGEISKVLQYSTYLEPQAGRPLFNLISICNISDFKTDDKMVLTISHLVRGLGYVKVLSKTYSYNRNSVFSARESEILNLSVDGLSNKIIADKLFISIQTVKNHKRNMMKKTNARNIVELINLSQKNHWI